MFSHPNVGTLRCRENLEESISSLHLRISLARTRVEKLLQKHTDYFVRVGGAPKFALNRFDKFNGSSERIIADVERSCKRAERSRTTVLILSAVGALLGVVAMIFLD